MITSIQNCKILGGNLPSISFEGKVRNYTTKPEAASAIDSYTGVRSAKKAPVTDVINGAMAKYAPALFMNKYLNQAVIEKAMQENPRIAEILIENGVEPQIYMENISGKSRNHFKTTYDAAKRLNTEMSDKEYSTLLEASLLHDIGKALIPASILNKPGKLTEEERRIVDLHADLGAEVLKTTDIDKKVVDAVRLHHTEYKCPVKKNNSIAQMLSVVDVYSALKEERPYKPKMSDEKVRDIMTKDIKLNPHFTGKLVKNSTVPLFA